MDDVLTTDCSYPDCRDALRERATEAELFGIFIAHCVIDRSAVAFVFTDLTGE